MIKVDSGEEWTFDKLGEISTEIEKIAAEKYDLDYYPNHLEIISSEQMLDAYSAVGLPIYYSHWTFGEQFVKELEEYRRGRMGLAYEIVINSSPCISYLMEENTMLMQTLVIAHAAVGHNTFFKNNYLFRQWTDAEGIIDYLKFAKKFIKKCEELHGEDEVEAVLDAAHALQVYGVDKYRRPSKISAAKEEVQRKERDAYIQSQLNVIWSTIPDNNDDAEVEEKRFPAEPQENLLYFIEKNAPRLEEWKREIIRIVRRISQYFHPQRQLQLMNEGCATYFHYKIMGDLYDKGMLTDGAWLEFIHSHSGVVKQYDFDERGFSGGFNPYALGWAMYKDIERVSMEPTQEDRDWFLNQKWVGNGDYLANIKWAIENFKDESFIQQFLSPTIIRKFRMFNVTDDETDPMLEVAGIHNVQGYKNVRDALAKQYNIGYKIPDIQVYDVDKWGDRSMTLRHYMVDDKPLDRESTTDTLRYVSYLWGYDVKLESVDINDKPKASYQNNDGEPALDIFLDED